MLPRTEAGGGRPGSEEGRCLGEVLLCEARLSGGSEGGRTGWAAFGVREELWFCCPWRRPSLLSLLCCVQGILCYSPATDVVRSGYIVVRQKHCPLPAGQCLCFCGSQGSTLLPRTGCCLLSEPHRLAGLIVSPPGWVLLSQACSCSPGTCCFSLVATPASPTHLHPPLRRGLALQTLLGYLSFWNLRSLTLVFIHLSLKADDLSTYRQISPFDL